MKNDTNAEVISIEVKTSDIKDGKLKEDYAPIVVLADTASNDIYSKVDLVPPVLIANEKSVSEDTIVLWKSKE